MAKKQFGKFVALATISGVIAAGISYFLKYKSFNNELDEEFHNFEGDDDEFDGELPHAYETNDRAYVTLNEKKEEAADAVKTAAETVTEGTETVAGKAEDAVDAVEDKAEDVVNAAADYVDDMSQMVKDAVTDTAEAVKNAVENMSATIEDDEI